MIHARIGWFALLVAMGTPAMALTIDRMSVRWVGLQSSIAPGVFPGFSGGMALGARVGGDFGLCLEYRGTASRQGGSEWLPTSWSSLANAGNDEAAAIAFVVLTLLYPLTCNLHQGWMGLSVEWEKPGGDSGLSPYFKGGLGVSVDAWWPNPRGDTAWEAGPGILLESGFSVGERKVRHRFTVSTVLSPAHVPIQNRFSSRGSWVMGIEGTWSMGFGH